MSACVVNCVAVLVVPRNIGLAVLGETWEGAIGMLVPVVAVQLTSSVILVIGCALRTRGHVAIGARARLTLMPVALLSLVVGSLFANPAAIVIALACSNCLGCGIYLRSLCKMRGVEKRA
jgi:hypothetical protein